MINAQSFFSFSKDQELPIIPLLDVTLLDPYLIYFTISWQKTVQQSIKT